MPKDRAARQSVLKTGAIYCVYLRVEEAFIVSAIPFALQIQMTYLGYWIKVCKMILEQCVGGRHLVYS